LDLLDKDELRQREKEALDRYNTILEYSKEEAEKEAKEEKNKKKKDKE
jgi:hypothetical protein